MATTLPLILALKTVESGAMVAELHKYLILPASEEAHLLDENPNIPSPLFLLSQLDLPGFSPNAWFRLSNQIYKATTEYASVETIIHGESIMKDKILRYLPQAPPNEAIMNFFFIGDYSEIESYAALINDGKVNHGETFLAWSAFCPDPYSDIPNQERMNEIPITNGSNLMPEVFEFYDRHLGRHWNVGLDSTGLLNERNLLGMAKQTSMGVVVDFRRLNIGIINHNLLFRCMLAALRSCRQGGSVVLKFVIPHTPALRAMIAFFDIFFLQTEIFTLKRYSPDDNTIYLVGTKFNQELLSDSFYELLVKNSSPTEANPELGSLVQMFQFLLKYTNDPIPSIRQTYGPRIAKLVSTAPETWLRRN